MKHLILILTAFIGVPTAFAQGFFDDDIYYDSRKTPKKEVKKQQPQRQNATVVEILPADSYIPTAGQGVNRDIDEYNRRGIFAAPDTVTIPADSLNLQDFNYTRRIERFQNPEIIVASGDDELINYYYNETPASININITNYPDSYWGWGPSYYDPWYGWAGSWNNPWYNPWYGPSWSWSWGWGPSWGWNAGWGPSWAWGPAWAGLVVTSDAADQ